MGVEFRSTALSSVFILVPERFGDDRGYFEESWNVSALVEFGIEISFLGCDNAQRSCERQHFCYS